MLFKYWILVAAFLALAHAAAIEPLDLTAIEAQSQNTQQPERQVREKRTLLLAKKALLIGGAAGLGIGLAKGALLSHGEPVHPYPVQSYPVYPSYGNGGGGGWPGSHAHASASASSW